MKIMCKSCKAKFSSPVVARRHICPQNDEMLIEGSLLQDNFTIESEQATPSDDFNAEGGDFGGGGAEGSFD